MGLAAQPQAAVGRLAPASYSVAASLFPCPFSPLTFLIDVVSRLASQTLRAAGSVPLTRGISRAGLVSLCVLMFAACDAQDDGDYRGAEIGRIEGKLDLKSTRVTPPFTVALVWGALSTRSDQPPAFDANAQLGERVTVSGVAPVGFAVRVFAPPPTALVVSAPAAAFVGAAADETAARGALVALPADVQAAAGTPYANVAATVLATGRPQVLWRSRRGLGLVSLLSADGGDAAPLEVGYQVSVVIEDAP